MRGHGWDHIGGRMGGKGLTLRTGAKAGCGSSWPQARQRGCTALGEFNIYGWKVLNMITEKIVLLQKNFV